VPTIFPVYVAETTLAKQADLLPRGYVNIGTISRECLLEKSKLAQHAYEEYHRVGCDGARILEIGSNSRYKKHNSPSIIRMIKSRRMRWAGHAARMGEKRNAYRILVGKPDFVCCI
jgi:hypothetical protein